MKNIYIPIILLALLLASCRPTINNTEDQIATDKNLDITYPIIGDINDYPSPGYEITMDYPAPQPIEALQIPTEIKPFIINKPLNHTDKTISGTGPIGIPILLVDITMNGEIIGEAIIDNLGDFFVEVENLEVNHRIGIKINSSDGIVYKNNDYSHEGFQGNEPKLVPNIGYYFDTVLVE